ELSNRQIGEQTKNHHATVGKARSKLEAGGQLDKISSSIGADGRKRRRKSPTKSAANTTTNTTADKELTGPQKKLLTLLNADPGLLTSTIENFLPGLERWVALLFDSPALQDGLRAIVERKRWFAAVDQQETDQDAERRRLDDDNSSTDGMVVFELTAAPEPTPVFFDNPEEEPTPPLAPADADEWPEMPEDLDRRKQIEAAQLKTQPWLRHQPEKLRKQVLARIR
ncbi:MAG TPA: hypothetical protein VF913_13935, partial [Xanthobacteraceae bacterium]